MGKAATPKRLGFLIHSDPYGGGTYQWTMNLLYSLKEYQTAHHKVEILLFYYTGFEAAEYKLRFPEFQYVEIKAKLLAKIMRYLFFWTPKILRLMARFFPLSRAAKAHRLDLMIFPGANPDICLYYGKSMFLFCDISHCFYPDFPEIAPVCHPRNLIFQYGIRLANVIVVESEQLKKDIQKYYGADPNRTYVLFQTLSQTVERLSDETYTPSVHLPQRYLFYPAQLWAHKNHPTLFRALREVLDKGHDVHLVLVGSRQSGDETIFALIDELQLQDRVLYLGYVEDNMMRYLYQHAVALVMPTYFGPTNIPTLEAFFYGCPAIISDLPGVEDQSRDAAMRINPDSAQAWAQGIIHILTEPEAREALIEKGAKRILELSYPQYSSVFHNILDASW